ncbi:MAG: bifunctional folylpolyglutamate synthase/dihydrofolate synthase [Burkholderiaceae bacterium]
MHDRQTSPGLSGWLDRLTERRGNQIRLGLDRLLKVTKCMGLPMQGDDVRLDGLVMTVGGTNGKGSTCAFLESIAVQSGYRVSCYTSPHLFRFQERLRFNGEEVEDQAWEEAFDKVEKARLASGDIDLSFFEVTTLAAITIVQRLKPDLAIFEIGMGGRLDAVNCLASDAAVLTSIDLDHQAFLGPTREKIAWEKAHIARKGCPFVLADPSPPEGLLELLKDKGADVWWIGRDFGYEGDKIQWQWWGRSERRSGLGYPALRGINQLLNASAALAALSALRQKLAVHQGGVRQGLAQVSLPGRFQVLPGQPAVVLDVAHNPHAAGVLAANLDQMGFFPKTVAVVGMLADKDAAAIFARLGGRVDSWCLASLSSEQAGARARLASELRPFCEAMIAGLSDTERPVEPVSIFEFDNPELALRQAASLVGPNDRIIVFGSFVTVAQAWPLARSLGQAPHLS